MPCFHLTCFKFVQFCVRNNTSIISMNKFFVLLSAFRWWLDAVRLRKRRTGWKMEEECPATDHSEFHCSQISLLAFDLVWRLRGKRNGRDHVFLLFSHSSPKNVIISRSYIAAPLDRRPGAPNASFNCVLMVLIWVNAHIMWIKTKRKGSPGENGVRIEFVSQSDWRSHDFAVFSFRIGRDRWFTHMHWTDRDHDQQLRRKKDDEWAESPARR